MPGASPQRFILLVEDEPTLQRILGSVLGDAGHRVEAVGTAEAALDRLDEGDVDLVLTDKNLPKMSGLELLAEVRRQEAGGRRATGVVMVTGYPSRDSALQALADDADGYLVKPFRSLTHAVEQVRRVLDADLPARRRGPPLARRVAAALQGMPGTLVGVRVALVGVGAERAAAAVGAAGATIVNLAEATDPRSAPDVVVGGAVEDLVAATATLPAACVLVDGGATFQDLVALIGCGGGAVVDGDLISEAA